MDIFRSKGSVGGIRLYRNNLVFLVAYGGGVEAMYAAARRHLAMSKLAAPDSMSGFADYQKKEILDRKTLSDDKLNEAVLKCYKYAYYPIRGDILDYVVMDWKERGDQQPPNRHAARKAARYGTDGGSPRPPRIGLWRESALLNGARCPRWTFVTSSIGPRHCRCLSGTVYSRTAF